MNVASGLGKRVPAGRWGAVFGWGCAGLACVRRSAKFVAVSRYPRSDAAVFSAAVVGIASRVSGPIVELPVRENDFVGEGRLLFRIDPAPYEPTVAASVQAAEARLRAARRARLPEFAIEGVAAATRFDTGIEGAGPLDAFGLGLQNYGGFLTVQWPVFTGFAAENRERAAQVAKDAASEELALAREHTISEVWRAYPVFLNWRHRQRAKADKIKIMIKRSSLQSGDLAQELVGCGDAWWRLVWELELDLFE